MRVFACVLCLLLLSSCGFMPLAVDAEELLVAPVLSREQAQLSDALRRVVDLDDIVYRYPRYGEHRSSIIFFDLDGDGLYEALVFYSHRASPEQIRMMLLRQATPGSWYSFYDIAGSGNEIEFVRFAPIHEPDLPSIIIGWNCSIQQQSWLGVYTLRERHRLVEDFLERSGAHIILDVEGSGTNQIFIAHREGASFVLRLLRSRAGRVIEAARTPLYEDTTAVMQILYGRLWDGSTGLFVDEHIDNAFYGTEVFRVTCTSITPLSAGTGSHGTQIWANFVSTFREEYVLSAHLVSSYYVEVPRIEHLPGDGLLAGEMRLPPLIQYMRLGAGGFQVRYNVVINPAGYLIFMPEHWLDNVTLVEAPEFREWSFRQFDHETGRPAVELLRIRIRSTEDFFGSPTENDVLLATRGISRYYANIPPRPPVEYLAVSREQVLNMFKLLDR